jgi:hypothetical protein
MKILARIGAILSFTFFLLPGAWLTFRRASEREAGLVILGLILLGIAFFVGPMLWLAGEKCSSNQSK